VSMTDLCGVSGGAGSFYERGRGRQAIQGGCPLTWCCGFPTVFAVAACAIAIASKFLVTIHAKARHKVFVLVSLSSFVTVSSTRTASCGRETKRRCWRERRWAKSRARTGDLKSRGAFGDFLGLWPHDLDVNSVLSRDMVCAPILLQL
jgi:hypothetical protein